MKEKNRIIWGEGKWVCVTQSVWGRVKRRQEEGGAELWYFKARHWHKSPQRRRGSGSSQGRVSRAMGQPLPGLACWYLQMSSLKCWRSLLLLKRSPECLGSCSRVEGTQRGPLWPNTAALKCQWAPPPTPSPPASHTHTDPPVHNSLFPKQVPQLLKLPNR